MEEALARLWQAVTQDWPGIRTEAALFMKHLALRIPGGADALEGLRGLRASDLYLAHGCLLGDPAALSAFEQHFVARVPAYLARGNASADFIEEAKQGLRTRLLTGDQTPPRIAAYSGHGPLGAWVRMTTLRVALDLDQTPGRLPSAYRFEAHALTPAMADPELATLKSQAGALLNQAASATLAALSPREAALVRLFFLQEVSYGALAKIYHAPTSRVRRWIADIRAKIVEETRRHLIEKLAVTSSNVDSLIRLVSSDVDLSVVRILKRTPKE